MENSPKTKKRLAADFSLGATGVWEGGGIKHNGNYLEISEL